MYKTDFKVASQTRALGACRPSQVKSRGQSKAGSQIQVHTHKRTQVHSTRSSTHPSMHHAVTKYAPMQSSDIWKITSEFIKDCWGTGHWHKATGHKVRQCTIRISGDTICWNRCTVFSSSVSPSISISNLTITSRTLFSHEIGRASCRERVSVLV